jgi:pimeloyl-ACP methyl ester carboxylesterase
VGRVAVLGVMIIATLLVLRLAVVSRGGDDVPLRVLTPSACTFAPPAGVAASRLACGTMRAPEDRAKPGGRAVDIAYAVIRATDAQPAPDALLYLDGGPGGATLERAADLYRGALGPVSGTRRDLVLLDQRGTGTSRPELTCTQANSGPVGIAGPAATPLGACRLSYEGLGVQLAAYNSDEMAADAAELMHALGYDAYDALGISYGTRVALTLIRDYPRHVRAVILDSTLPLEADLIGDLPSTLGGALDALVRDCAAQAPCAAAYPDLGGTLETLIASFDASPQTVTVRAPSGRVVTARISGDLLLSLFNELLRNNPDHRDRIAGLPSLIARTAAGDLQPLAQAVEQVNGSGGSVALADYYAVMCQEAAPLTDPIRLTAGPRPVHPAIDRLLAAQSIAVLDACVGGPTSPPDAPDHQPVRATTPALILSGELDPVTPPAYARMAAADLPASTLLEFPGLAHGVIIDACAQQAAAAFLDDPGRAPAPACLAKRAEPAFTTP